MSTNAHALDELVGRSPYARVWTELDDLSTMSCNNPPVGCCVCVLVLVVVVCLWAFA